MHEVTKRIVDFNRPRIPKMVRQKYKLMAQDAFKFYRGTCHLFYEDLAQAGSFPGAPLGWICGDLHPENFGSYRSDNDQVYFDLNDFDEAVLAPVTWELVRFLTSIFVVFESLGIEKEKAHKMAKLCLKSYVATLAKGKPDYEELANARGILKDFLTKVDKRRQLHMVATPTTVKKKRLQMLLDNPKHFRLKDRLKHELERHVQEWLKVDESSPYNYKVADGIFRLAGIGGVGLERYTFLLKSRNDNGPKYMLLDMKEAAPSSFAQYLNCPQPDWKSEAERVVSVQRKMENRCPALLSTTEFHGKAFVMQEMQPTEDSIRLKSLRKDYGNMYSLVDTMALLTASSQLRSSGQAGSATTDELQAFAADAAWQQEVMGYAMFYAGTVKQDYEAFVADFENGQIQEVSAGYQLIESDTAKVS